MSKYHNDSEFKIADPCGQSWDEMKGNEKVRVCEHCDKAVNNVSQLTRKEAMRLVRSSNGSVCLRYYVDLNTRRPIFIDGMQKLAVRSGVSAGVLTASIALAGGTYAQDQTSPQNVVTILPDRTSGGDLGSVTGVVTDPQGAVFPFAVVSLTNSNTGEYRVANANNEGYYEFKDLPFGSYKIRFEAGSFPSRDESINVSQTAMIRRDVQLPLPQVGEVVNVTGESLSTYVTVDGGAMGIVASNPLVEAVLRDDLKDVKARVMMRAKVNVRDKGYDGISPLHAAVENGNLEMVQFLLDQGAKTNIRDFEKRTPLMMMDEDATPELLQLMLRYGAKMDVVDKEGNTLLMHFAENDQDEIIRYMIASGIPLNAKNKKGETALMIAADNGKLVAVKALLESGADTNLVSSDGSTAIEMTGDESIRSLLISYGAIAKAN